MLKPMLITYRVPLLTEALFKMISKVRKIGLVNIIAGREIMPELIQRDATPEKVASKVLEIVLDKDRMEKLRMDLAEVKLALGPKGASKRAAETIVEFVREKNLL
jgi:lipid-A-disaccharide synthase